MPKQQQVGALLALHWSYRRIKAETCVRPGCGRSGGLLPRCPTLNATTGERKRPWVFRLTLSHPRRAYEVSVWDQRIEAFIRLHERAFRKLGGVPSVVHHDKLKAAVMRACLYGPDVSQRYTAFAPHWGFTPLPSLPRHPQENGKQERSGGYVKDNALKGRCFERLDAQNLILRHRNRTVARLRIHGTTRK